MRTRLAVSLRTVLVLAGLAGRPLRAQDAPDSSASTDSAAVQGGGKKGALLGKVKHVAQSKVVQEVAKTAACTVVPGGQVVAGAIDAAASKDSKDAATGAAEAATGTACANTLGHLTTAPDRAAQSLAQPSAPPQLDPRMQSQLNMVNAMGMGMPTDEESQAKCLGVSVEEYRLIVYPPGMNGRPPTKAEMKARSEAMKKLDPRKQQECMMNTSAAVTAQARQAAATMEQRQAQAGGLTEAPGGSVELPADLEAALGSGTVVVGGIDWVAGSARVSDAGAGAFQDAMTRLGAALQQAGGRYRLDLYFDNRYADDALATLGPQRLALIQSALTGAGVEPGHLGLGQAQRDPHPRLEVVRVLE